MIHALLVASIICDECFGLPCAEKVTGCHQIQQIQIIGFPPINVIINTSFHTWANFMGSVNLFSSLRQLFTSSERVGIAPSVALT